MHVLRNAVLLACRAPSVHNSQPWRWVADGDAVHLFVDRHRIVPATDHSGREALLSCGAALDHFRVAMTAAGRRTHVTRFPNPDEPEHLATIEFGRTEHVTAAQRNRAGAILQRRTDRLPFDSPTYWHLFEPALRSTLDECFETGDITLHVVAEEQRPRLAEASRLSAALRRDDSSYHAELQWWTSPFAMSEGIPPPALASAAERRRVDVAREFPVRGHQNRRPEITADWSRILVLSTPEDTRSTVLRCGEVLSTVLLECTMAGMATCTLTHLIESAQSRDVVRELTGGRGESQSEPQVLIRVGIAPAIEPVAAPTPRRPLDAVLQVHPSHESEHR